MGSVLIFVTRKNNSEELTTNLKARDFKGNVDINKIKVRRDLFKIFEHDMLRKVTEIFVNTKFYSFKFIFHRGWQAMIEG